MSLQRAIVCVAVLLAMTFLSFCSQISNTLNQETSNSTSNTTGEKATKNYSYTILDSDSAANGFGYNIYSDGKLMIHQPTIPAVSGMVYFKSREDASKTALAVIEKIKKGEMPPTISLDELRNLGVIE